MPQSLAVAYLHVVFSTKDRLPMIGAEHQDVLWAYLGGICRRLGCPSLTIGGTQDHVHLLIRLNKTTTIADLLRDIKSNSSSWMHKRLAAFQWQAGYAAFTFSEADVSRLRHYVANQEEHHQTVSFQDELRSLLRQSGQEWDERYLWD